MCGLDFAVDDIIVLLPLQRYDLRFGEHFTRLGNVSFQSCEPLLEGLEITAQPDGAHARRRNEDTALA